MDRQAFKLRMQNLKSYRENNPGKGYWDWKVTAYQPGGETGEDDKEARRAEFHRQIAEDEVRYREHKELSRKAMQRKQTTQPNYRPRTQEEIARDSARAARVLHDIDLVMTAMREMAKPQVPTGESIKEAATTQEEERKDKFYPYKLGLKSTYEAIKLILAGKGIDNGVRLLRGMPGTNLGTSVELAGEIIDGLEGTAALARSLWDDVVENAAQVAIGEFGRRNYEPYMEIDPKTGADITPWWSKTKYKGLIGLGILGNAYQIYDSGKLILGYLPGGEIGDDDDLKLKFYEATGRNKYGVPIELGLKPVFDLEDAANMTPIGDAISARDTYNAVKNRDWLSAGLAALTVLPFVPSGLRNVKAAARYIPTVNRTEQSLINLALGNISKKRDYLSDIANSRNRVLEDINTIPYRNRAELADKIFGTNYSETYDLLDDLYQHRYFDLPEVQPKDMVASGRLLAKPFAEERFNKTGVGAEPNEFDLWVNTGMYRDPMQLANHEMNHYTDYIISRNANTTINNNMLKQLENSLKLTDATSYYRKGTELKAYMNLLRTMLKLNADVLNLDEPVSSTLLKKYLDKMSDSNPIKKMFKQHKNINAYTKWFNTIPLLGTTALGANAYFNNNKDE